MTRRDQILRTAAELFARHGYHGVSINDLGAACGISGPALYKHFRGKQAILSEMLVEISDELLTEGRRRVREASDDAAALDALIDWHVGFALEREPLIVVQDREWAALPAESRERVRETQRKYVEVWVRVLRRLRPERSLRATRAMVHACFGLINSTPHSALTNEAEMRELLASMARAALTVA
ncbi:MAG: SACE_7040 family transcriptional regulator [Marmoricola sp.]